MLYRRLSGAKADAARRRDVVSQSDTETLWPGMAKNLGTFGRTDQAKPSDFAVRLRNLKTNHTKVQIPYGADGMSFEGLRDCG